MNEIEPGLFFVNDQVYQSAFLVTDAGVVVFDAPPSIGERLRAVIETAARDYAWDVRDTVAGLMPGFYDRFTVAIQAVDFQNSNLGYRHAIESVRDEYAAQIIDRWQDELSAANIWADSHCETAVIYAIMH